MTSLQEQKIKRCVFVAFRYYDEDFEPVIIIAENVEEARVRGEKYFGLSSFALKPLVKTASESVYDF